MMKKPYFLIVSLVFLMPFISSCNLNCITASGKSVAESRNTDPFTKVEMGGGMQVFLKQGNESTVNIEADQNIMPLIKTEVRDHTLHISTGNNVCNSGTIKVYITSPVISAVDASGAVEIANAGILKSDKFNLDLSGACKALLSIDAGEIETESSGASVITLKGKAKSHRIDMSGAVELDAESLVVEKYDIETSGACKLKIHVTDELRSSSSGASEISYHGQPKVINSDNSGASKLHKLD